MEAEENTIMNTRRLHPYKISKKEATAALHVPSVPGTLINRLERLLKIRTGKSRHLIGQGFRNDIMMIINAAK